MATLIPDEKYTIQLTKNIIQKRCLLLMEPHNFATLGSTFVMGIWVGIMLVVATVDNTDNITTQAKTAREQCEKSLPRDQHCKITAIPVLGVTK